MPLWLLAEERRLWTEPSLQLEKLVSALVAEQSEVAEPSASLCTSFCSGGSDSPRRSARWREEPLREYAVLAPRICASASPGGCRLSKLGSLSRSDE